jgi:hypothetical protein
VDPVEDGGSGKTLSIAESLWHAGHYDDAWLAIEDLEPIDRVEPAVVSGGASYSCF